MLPTMCGGRQPYRSGESVCLGGAAQCLRRGRPSRTLTVVTTIRLKPDYGPSFHYPEVFTVTHSTLRRAAALALGVAAVALLGARLAGVATAQAPAGAGTANQLTDEE